MNEQEPQCKTCGGGGVVGVGDFRDTDHAVTLSACPDCQRVGDSLTHRATGMGQPAPADTQPLTRQEAMSVARNSLLKAEAARREAAAKEAAFWERLEHDTDTRAEAQTGECKARVASGDGPNSPTYECELPWPHVDRQHLTHFEAGTAFEWSVGANELVKMQAARITALTAEVEQLREERYLPVPCPCCGRLRLLYQPSTHQCHCEKCGADNDLLADQEPVERAEAAEAKVAELRESLEWCLMRVRTAHETGAMLSSLSLMASAQTALDAESAQ